MGVLTNKRSKKKMALQLTSLLDMFTIILVFLMQSFQAEDKDFVLHAGLQLPQSNAQNPFKTAVNLAITPTAIVIEGKEVYHLQKGARIQEVDKEASNLEAVASAVKNAWGSKKKELDEEDIVVIQADKQVPYRTIHMVMRSAAHSGFFRFRLAIEKE